MTDFTTITACGECCVGCSKKIEGSCPGCIEADGRVPEWAESGRCKVHACAREHGVQFCGLCREFPCEKLPAMISWNANIIDHLTALRDEYMQNTRGENMELWDLYDSERKPLNRTHVRGEAFAEGEYYVCAEVWVRNSKGELLITKRHPNKKAGNLWEFTGGGTLAGESTKLSAIRELQEETGIQAKESELQLITTYQHKNYFQDLFLLCKDMEISKVVLQPEEAVDAKWASDETILQMIENGEFVYSVGQRFKEYKGEIQPSGELGSTKELLYSNAGKV